MINFRIRQSHVGLLYEDGRFVRILPAGTHRLGRRIFDRIERTVVPIDLRERSLIIKGQEILTADKVAIRVSLLVYFRVTDPAAAAHNVASYEQRIYEDVQLAARRFLANRDLDAILSDRNEVSEAVRDTVQSAAASYGVEIVRADIKDLMFPGNLREIMNKVLETERRAEADLISARKEAEATSIRVAAENEAELRQLQAEKERVQLQSEMEQERHEIALATMIAEAEAMEKHPALMKLKKLETMRHIADESGRFVIGLKAHDLTDAFTDD